MPEIAQAEMLMKPGTKILTAPPSVPNWSTPFNLASYYGIVFIVCPTILFMQKEELLARVRAGYKTIEDNLQSELSHTGTCHITQYRDNNYCYT